SDDPQGASALRGAGITVRASVGGGTERRDAHGNEGADKDAQHQKACQNVDADPDGEVDGSRAQLGAIERRTDSVQDHDEEDPFSDLCNEAAELGNVSDDRQANHASKQSDKEDHDRHQNTEQKPYRHSFCTGLLGRAATKDAADNLQDVLAKVEQQ